MRKDFQELPPHAQAKMLDLLQQADLEHFDWWMHALVGDAPELPEAMPPPRADPSAYNNC